MKPLFRLLYIAIAIALVACGHDKSVEPTPEPEGSRSYTIMTYGCGGKDLDYYYEETIKNITRLDVPDHINIVGQMKWSNGYTSDFSDGSGAVTRFKYDHSTMQYSNNVVSDNSFEIDSADNLAQFIEWARSEAPADEYIIVFMGHGNAYHPGFEGDTTRGILRDDEEVKYLGLSAIVKAFETSDANFSLVFMMSCLLNSIEYITELTPYTDYYLASSHPTTISSGELYFIVEKLISIYPYDERSIVDAATYYINQDYDNLYDQDYLTIDHTLTECEKIATLNSIIGEFVDIVVALYEQETAIGGEAMSSRYGFTTATIDDALSSAYYPVTASFSESAIANLQWYRLDYAFDIVDIVRNVAEATQLGELADVAARIEFAATEAILHQRAANLFGVQQSYYTVTLVNKEQWTTLGYEECGYTNTAFDVATGWNRLLKSNNATFLHCR